MTNLPNFPGASVVYSRAMKVAEYLNTKEYERQKTAARGKKFRFTPSYDAVVIIQAMNKGDEEVLKSMNYQFMHVFA